MSISVFRQAIHHRRCAAIISHSKLSCQQALQRIAGANVRFSGSKVREPIFTHLAIGMYISCFCLLSQCIMAINFVMRQKQKRPFFWPTILSLKEAIPSLLTFSAASVCAIAIVLGIILARKIDVHIPFINDA